MVKIHPFRGIRYNQARLNSVSVGLEKVIAPPYDEISAREKLEKFNHGYNIQYIDSGIETPFDNKFNNKYTRSARRLETFFNDGILKIDEKPAIYVYEQVYTIDSEQKTRRAITALVELEGILPHEDTLPAKLNDRLEMLRACRTHFSPAFGLYENEDLYINKLLKTDYDPIIDIEFEGVKQTVWSITDERIREIEDFFLPKTIVIADGHHRHEAALHFKEEFPEANCEMMSLVDMKDATILPRYRILDKKFKPEDMIGFYFKELPFDRLLKQVNRNGIGMYSGGKFYLLKNESDQLDVAVLHRIFNQRGIKDEDIIYTKNREEALKLADEKNGTAYFPGPLKVEEVKSIANSKKIPEVPKLTYFYPKFPSGVVMYKFE